MGGEMRLPRWEPEEVDEAGLDLQAAQYSHFATHETLRKPAQRLKQRKGVSFDPVRARGSLCRPLTSFFVASRSSSDFGWIPISFVRCYNQLVGRLSPGLNPPAS